MSVGTVPGDIQAPQGGFEGAASPSIPATGEAGFPTGESDAALTPSPLTSAPASEGAEQVGLAPEDIEFLQSEQVRDWLRENLPQGLLTEDAHNQRIASLQSTKDREIADARQQLTGIQGQVAEREAQLATLVEALYAAWQESGLERGSQEWQQREAQIAGLVRQQANEREIQRARAQQAQAAEMVQEVGRFNGDLDFIGLGDQQAKAFAQPYLSQHIKNIQTGYYQNPAQIEQGRRAYIQMAREAYQQQAQPTPAPQPRPQPQQAQRPNPGPLRSARGGGGAVPRSMNDIYQERYAALVETKGGLANITPDEIDNLWVEAAIAAG